MRAAIKVAAYAALAWIIWGADSGIRPAYIAAGGVAIWAATAADILQNGV